MEHRSKIVMLAGLAVLFLTVNAITGSSGFAGFHVFSSIGRMLPWVLLAVGFWLFFGKNGGCCNKREE